MTGRPHRQSQTGWGGAALRNARLVCLLICTYQRVLLACTLYTLERLESACNFLTCTIHLDQLADPSVSWISRPAFALPSIVWHTMGCIVCPFVVALSTTGILKEQSLSLSCIKYAGCMLRPHRPHVLSQQLRIHCIVYVALYTKPKRYIQGGFFNCPPPPLKSSKHRKVNLGQVRCILDDLRQRRFT